MPSVTTRKAVTSEQAAEALQKQLGEGYQVATHGEGSLTVKRGPLAFATVRLSQEGDTTIFRVHGGGLIVGRIINELAMARTVAAAISESLGSGHSS